ncbi:hypothetical protein M2110_002847 [Paenibacillus sp. PastF-4]|nr:hypothetical protein [Paenibacillus sp. PastF-4]
MFKGCIHKDNYCNGITSKAHSIQNNRYLNKLSDNGEVLCIDFGKLGLRKKLSLESVGRGKASIFTGFCNHHDKEIFLPIEKYDYKLNDTEQNYLFAYRAFALAYYERHSSFGFMKEHLEIKKKKGENTKEYEQKVNFYKKHLTFIEQLKNSMNNNLDNKRFDRISTEIIVWPHNYGIAATSMFFVNKDKFGRIINDPQYYISPFFFTIIPQENKTFVLMSYLTKDKNRYKFLKQQIVNTETFEQQMLISNLLAMNVENFFISPEKWAKIPSNIQKMYIDILESTMGGEKPRIGYFGNLNIFNNNKL